MGENLSPARAPVLCLGKWTWETAVRALYTAWVGVLLWKVEGVEREQSRVSGPQGGQRPQVLSLRLLSLPPGPKGEEGMGRGGTGRFPRGQLGLASVPKSRTIPT